MKSLFYLLPIFFIVSHTSCKKDKDKNTELAKNTWSFSVIRPNQTATVYGMLDIALSTQVYGLVRIRSEQGAISGGNGSGGDGCDVNFYFKSIPLASKVYKITSIANLSRLDENEVAISLNVSGDPALASKFNSVWSSTGDGSQTMNYTFVNSKCSFSIKDIKIRCESNYINQQDALFSANIVQP